MTEAGRCAARQIRGKRHHQEDDYGFLDACALGMDPHEHSLLLVADGMGGHVGGATASGLLREIFVEAYPRASGPITDRLQGCLQAANTAMAEAIARDPDLDSMGSTLVAAVVSSQGLHWISVGDSPLWLFRKGSLERLNADHSMTPVLADLVATGRMTEDEAARDPGRHSLRSAVMGGEIHLMDLSPEPFPVERGDRLLLASDGLMTLGDRQIAGILEETQDASLEHAAADLIQAVEAADRPHQDNVTLVLYAPAGTTAPVDRGLPRLRRWARRLGRAAGRMEGKSQPLGRS